MNFKYKERVKDRLYKNRQYHLIPMFNDVLGIAKRIYEYDSEFFVVFNSRKNRFELHSLEHYPDTYAMAFREKLDQRALWQVWENDIRIHGENIFKDIEKLEEKAEKDRERQFKNWVEDVAKETRSLIAKDAWY